MSGSEKPRQQQWFEPEKPQVDRVFDRAEVSKALREASDERGLIRTQIVDEIAIQRLAKEIYKDWRSGVRELLANEFRALRTAKKKYAAEGELVISVDTVKSQLVIWGKNSLGIGVQKFLDVLRVIGRSDNFDEDEVGYFGMGFLSYATLSDTIKLETRSRETEERFAVLGRNALAFEVIPPEDDFVDYGTRLTIPFSANPTDVVERVRQVCQFQSDLTVQIVIDGHDRGFATRPFRSFFAGENENKGRRFDREGLTIVCSAVSSTAQQYAYGGEVAVFNYGIPLASFSAPVPLSVSERLVFAVNVLNERMYKPMPSRDDLTQEAKQRICAAVEDCAAEIAFEQAEKEEDTYAAFDGLSFLADRNRPVPERHAAVFADLRTTYKVLNGQGAGWGGYGTPSLYEVIDHTTRSKKDDYHRWKKCAIVPDDTPKTRQALRGKCEYIIVADTPEKAGLLENYGIGKLTIVDYADELITCIIKGRMSRVHVSEMTPHFIACPDSLKAYAKLSLDDYVLCRLTRKQLKSLNGTVPSIDEFVQQVANQKVLTNKGRVFVSEALADTLPTTSPNDAPHLSRAYSTQIAEILMRENDGKTLHLVGTPKQVQAIQIYCAYHDKPYLLDKNIFDLVSRGEWEGYGIDDQTLREVATGLERDFMTDKRMFDLGAAIRTDISPHVYAKIMEKVEEWARKYGIRQQNSQGN